MKSSLSRQRLIESVEDIDSDTGIKDPLTRPLSQIEKTFLLSAERGDCPTVKRIIERYKDSPEEFDINCVDPLSRSALVSGIENENIELIKLLLEFNIEVQDGLLHAIKEEYVEAVDLLLQWEEENHVLGEPYSWEKVDRSQAAFTADITPLILAAHKNNYEIIKILLDRGASLPMPHDVRCGCDECVQSNNQDSLRHSQARINAYKALTSPSLIALSSSDPLLTAFELSRDLRRLSRLETEFRAEYNEMIETVENFATSLVDHSRTSNELEVILNYDPDGDVWQPGERQTLERLKLAIKYRQKKFIAHPSVQQLLAAIWYEGLPGFRRKSMMAQMVSVFQLGIMFPVYCTIYMLAPESKMGLFMKKPFVKFICHSMSYAFFLMLLGCASQRIEIVALELFGTEWVLDMVKEWKRKERGSFFGIAECGVIIYVSSLIWAEIKSLWSDGFGEYLSDLWNIVDFVTNMFYVIWFALRSVSIFVTWREEHLMYSDPWYPREMWDTFEPILISEGAFAAGMIFSFLKLVHIFSVNPHLGPLQISLGRMIIDIVKFFFIYSLVLFAFGCGLNQLLWYYAELEKNKCFVGPHGLPDFENNDKACQIWRRYSNLFETSQSLFWASFGLVDLISFDLTGIKGFTRFWALLMFGSYSVINVIVLLNMLIAMMSNSYQMISERSDTEWKFARSRLWISYFEDGDTVPPPFNLIPSPKIFLRKLGIYKKKSSTKSLRDKSRVTAKDLHETVMKLLVRRYVTAEQRKRDDYGVTEDDVMEIRQDISTLRYELINILHNNGMKTPQINITDTQVSGKKGKEMERRILKDFHIGIVENLFAELRMQSNQAPDSVFGHIAKAIGGKTSLKARKKDWNALVRKNSLRHDPIGTSREANMRRQSLRGHLLSHAASPTALDDEKLIEYNPKLSEIPRGARVAYVKFMTKKLTEDFARNEESAEGSMEKSERSEKKKSVTLDPGLSHLPSKPESSDVTVAYKPLEESPSIEPLHLGLSPVIEGDDKSDQASEVLIPLMPCKQEKSGEQEQKQKPEDVDKKPDHVAVTVEKQDEVHITIPEDEMTQEESPKKEESPKTEESPTKEESSKKEPSETDSSKKEEPSEKESPKKEESPKKAMSPKIEESPKKEEPPKREESPIQESPKKEESSKKEEEPTKQEESEDEANKEEEATKQESPKQASPPPTHGTIKTIKSYSSTSYSGWL